ncbi:hypothetical protein HID58_034303, partial [Brassica napus]
ILNWHERLIRVRIDRSADRCCLTDSKSFVLTGKGHLKYFYNPWYSISGSSLGPMKQTDCCRGSVRPVLSGLEDHHEEFPLRRFKTLSLAKLEREAEMLPLSFLNIKNLKIL